MYTSRVRVQSCGHAQVPFAPPKYPTDGICSHGVPRPSAVFCQTVLPHQSGNWRFGPYVTEALLVLSYILTGTRAARYRESKAGRFLRVPVAPGIHLLTTDGRFHSRYQEGTGLSVKWLTSKKDNDPRNSESRVQCGSKNIIILSENTIVSNKEVFCFFGPPET